MSRWVMAIVLAPLLVPAPASATERLVVGFRSGATAAQRGAAREHVGARLVRTMPALGDVQVVNAPSGALPALRRRPGVAWAERDVRLHALSTTPSDPLYPQEWWLPQIQAPQAWATTTGAPAVTVAVVDTGVAGGHPDLDPNLWRNPGEIPGNGLDDDDDGLVDDVRGWNYVARDADTFDDNGHGTHVAGTIAARGDDGAGMAGVAWNVRVMPIKVLDALGEGWGSNIAQGIAYAGRMGAQVVNLSLGGGYSHAIAAALAAYPQMLAVTAAGNDGADSDTADDAYPCALPLPNIVCAAATDRTDHLAPYSNTGAQSVDLAAPGDDILAAQPYRQTELSEDFEHGPGAFTQASGWTVAAAPDGGHAFTATVDADTTLTKLARAETDFFVTPPDAAGCELTVRLRIDGPGGVGIDGITGENTYVEILNEDAQAARGQEQTVEPVIGEGGGFFPWGAGDWGQTKLELQLWGGAGAPTTATLDDLAFKCLQPDAPAGESFRSLSGTSMAAAVTSGVAALLYSRRPDADVADVEHALLAGTDPLPQLAAKVASGGRLDAARALAFALGQRVDPAPPPPPAFTSLPAPDGWRPGDLDPSWADGGPAIARWPDDGDTLGSAVPVAEPDGGLLVAAAAGSRFALARFDAHGRLEPGFGDGGQVSVPFAGMPQKVAATPSGGVVLVGDRAIDDRHAESVLMEYGADGHPDPGFATATFPIGEGWSTGAAVAPDGHVYATASDPTGGEMVVHAFDPDGSPDAGFGAGGAVSAKVGDRGFAQTVTVDPAGRLLVTGIAIDHGEGDGFIARLTPAGALDGTFGDHGVTLLPYASDIGDAPRVAVGPGGQIDVAGYGYDRACGDGDGGVKLCPPVTILVRLWPDGTLDRNFGAAGFAPVKVGKDMTSPTGIAALPDGRIVFAAVVDPSDGSGVSAAVARVLPAGWLDPGFGDAGSVVLPAPQDDRLPAASGGLLAGASGAVTVASTSGGQLRVDRLRGGATATAAPTPTPTSTPRPTAPTTPTLLATATVTPAPVPARLRASARRLRDGRVRVRLRCAGTVRCRGSLRLMRSTRVLARRSFTLAPGRTRTYLLARPRRRPTAVRIVLPGAPTATIRIRPAA
jgi:uncharacterized delta-60 repeat protein